MNALTFNELANEMFAIIEGKTGVVPSGAVRDLALSRTHLEDAVTRYNSARYRENGTWKRADPDRSAA